MSSGPEPDPFYLVWNPATGYTRHQHQSEQDARKEAERLARQVPGTKFFVLSVVACCRVPPPVTPMWTQYKVDIPF